MYISNIVVFLKKANQFTYYCTNHQHFESVKVFFAASGFLSVVAAIGVGLQSGLWAIVFMVASAAMSCHSSQEKVGFVFLHLALFTLAVSCF